MLNRRAVITTSAGLAVAALGYRAWDRGVFAGASGPAYAPWNDWQGSETDGNRRPLHAAILAASPHDTQPWRFALSDNELAVYADRARHLGTFPSGAKCILEWAAPSRTSCAPHTRSELPPTSCRRMAGSNCRRQRMQCWPHESGWAPGHVNAARSSRLFPDGIPTVGLIEIRHFPPSDCVNSSISRQARTYEWSSCRTPARGANLVR